eukprot:EG_transcript_67
MAARVDVLQPVWLHPAFEALFVDQCDDGEKRPPPEDGKAYSQLLATLGFVYNVLQNIMRELRVTLPEVAEAIRSAHGILAQAIQIGNKAPLGAPDHAKMQDLLNYIIMKVNGVQTGGIVVIPGGWCSSNGYGHALLYVIRRVNDSEFTFAICNSGDGLDPYHIMRMETSPPTAHIQYSVVHVVPNVPQERVHDSSFWYVLLRPLVQADDKWPQYIYESVVCYLNNQSLINDIDDKNPHFVWTTPPLKGDPAFVHCTLNCLQYIFRCLKIPPAHCEYIGLLIRWAMLRLVDAELHGHQCIPGPAKVMIGVACQQLARFSGMQVGPGNAPPAITLEQIQGVAKCIRGLEAKCQELAPPLEPFTSASLPAGLKVGNAMVYPLFGRLLLEDVEPLAGDARPPSIFLPVQMTLVPDFVASHHDAATALRHCDHLCTLLANQTELVQDTYCLRVALVQHLFLRVLPVPLPHGHPDKAKRCFWAAAPMRYADQADLLRLLGLVARHYSAAVFSLRVTRSFDAVRILTMACLAAITDAVLRVRACDVPSLFCLHYAGQAEGPVQPFGFDVGNFAVESEYLRFASPELNTVRTQVLDYFTQQRPALVPDDHVLFNFEYGMQLGPVARQLLNQLCLDTGFPRSEDLFALYFTGEKPELLLNFPEMGYIRDILFLFKTLMVPSSDALPPVDQWTPMDARLDWRYNAKEKVLVVTAFRTTLLPIVPVKEEKEARTGLFGRLRHMFSTVEKPRAPPSGANPSNLAKQRIDTEDDVLHLKDLPDFDGRLKASEVELLLQYLTVPYLRIPLVLQFFAEKQRINALRCEALQEVLDACLFEPGLWQPPGPKKTADCIPAPGRDHLATPSGLLFNELQKSPSTTLQAIEDMLTFALEKDPGRFRPSSGPLILYILRLAVQVEAFIHYLIRHNAWRARATAAGPPPLTGAVWETFARGLHCAAESLAVLAKGQERLRALMFQQAYPMLGRWCKRAIKDADIHAACVLHAHTAFLLRNVGDLTPQVVKSMLSSQVFLRVNYRFDLEADATEQRKRGGADRGLKQGLGIPSTEVFEVFQGLRARMLAWLQANPQQCNEIMEEIIQDIGQAEGGGQKRLSNRQWVGLPGPGNVGRFVPDTELDREAHLPRPGETYEAWLQRKTMSTDTEINVQLGELTLKKHHLSPLPAVYTKFADFADVFGTAASQVMQCAEVQHRTEREWLRLAGRRHDLQRWTPDLRHGKPYHTRPFPSSIKASEMWLKQAVAPFAKFLRGAEIFMPDSNVADATVVTLCSVVPGPAAKDGAKEPGWAMLREMVVLRHPPVVHVYNVVEHGRRYRRTLVFSSDVRWCLHNLESSRVVMQLDPRTDHPMPKLIAGEVGPPQRPAQSLVITRTLTAQVGLQTFVPAAHLQGLLPLALLDEYQFWQNRDGSLIGTQSGPKANPNKLQTTLRIEIRATSSSRSKSNIYDADDASAIIRRYAVAGDPADPLSPLAPPPPDSKPLTLLNLLYSPLDSPQRVLANALVRLDNLSHCLVWSAEEGRVDLVELPRLGLSFSAKHAPEWSKLYCQEHSGLFLTARQCPQAEQLMQALPNGVLLENDQEELFILVSGATRPCRPDLAWPEGALPRPLPSLKFPSDIILEHGNQEWVANITEAKHYLYPVHVSQAALFMPTLAAALYLLIMRFMTRKYEEVCQMVHACQSDTTLTPEEQQIWDLLESFALDAQPDAHACRLKLTLATLGCAQVMPCPWDLVTEMEGYVQKLEHISAGCRLTLQEEYKVLQLCGDGAGLPLCIRNRAALLPSLAKGSQEPVPILYPRPPTTSWYYFDSVQDRTCIEQPPGFWDKAFLQYFQQSAYARPLPEELQGQAGLQFLEKCIAGGLKTKGGKENLGFLFLYELLTGSLTMRVTEEDTSHAWGAILLRLLPAKETAEKSHTMSILRVLAQNRHLAHQIPKFKDERKIKTEVFLPGQGVLKGLMKDITKFLEANKGDIRWPVPGKPYEHPASTRVVPSPASYHWFSVPIVPEMACNARTLRPMVIPAPGGAVGLEVSSSDVLAFGTVPLSVLGLNQWVVDRPPSQQQPLEVPLSVARHSSAKTHSSLTLMNRLKDDVTFFAQRHNQKPEAQLLQLSESEVVALVRNVEAINAAGYQIQQLVKQMSQLCVKDQQFVHSATVYVVKVVNEKGHAMEIPADVQHKVLLRRLAVMGGLGQSIRIELLVRLLACNASSTVLRQINPLLEEEDCHRVLSLTAAILLATNRIGHVRRCIVAARDLLTLLVQARRIAKGELANNLAAGVILSLQQKAKMLAASVTAKRHYARLERDEKGQPVVTFDPRFLIFEFIHNIVLWEGQVGLVNKFVDAFHKSESLCHQLIMGHGKTTVVAPMLALMFAQGARLMLQVVPHALVEFSRNVMRERFSAFIHKPVQTFLFNRGVVVSRALVLKLRQASELGAVVCSNPTA